MAENFSIVVVVVMGIQFTPWGVYTRRYRFTDGEISKKILKLPGYTKRTFTFYMPSTGSVEVILGLS